MYCLENFHSFQDGMFHFCHVKWNIPSWKYSWKYS